MFSDGKVWNNTGLSRHKRTNKNNVIDADGFRPNVGIILANDQGRVLWASGRTNEFGAIVAGRGDEVLPSEQPVKNPDAAFQPHYQEITREVEPLRSSA